MVIQLEKIPEGCVARTSVIKEDKNQSTETLCKEADFEAQREAAKKVRRKKKRTASSTSLASNTFQELYRLTGEMLGQGAYASVQTCVNIYTDMEYAVKIIDKTIKTHSRSRVFKEIDMFHHCQGHHNITNLIEYFEESDKFFLVFEKVTGGQLLDRIASRTMCFWTMSWRLRWCQQTIGNGLRSWSWTFWFIYADN